MSQQCKYDTVTLVKAIGIILMVLGHVISSDTVVRNAIFTFHMPLFFLMSGYCFKEKYLDNAKQFVERKFKGIWLPFILFSLPYLAMHNVLCKWNIYDPDCLYGWKTFAWDAGRIVTRMSHNEGLLGTFWFLKELFWGNIIFYFAYKLSKGRLLYTIIGLFLLTEIVCIFHLRVPYFTITHTSTYAAFFIGVGYLWRVKSEGTNEMINMRNRRWWIWLIGILSVGIEALIVKDVAINTQTPLSMVYYTIPAIAGTMAVYEGCRAIEPHITEWIRSLMLFIGDHTLSIMALHFSAFKLVTYGYILLNNFPISRLADFPVIAECAKMGGGLLIYTFVGIFIPLLFAWLWQRGMVGIGEIWKTINKNKSIRKK